MTRKQSLRVTDCSRPTFDDDSDVVRHLSHGVLEETRVDAGVRDDDTLDGDFVVRRYENTSRPTQLLTVFEPRQRWNRNTSRLAGQLHRGAFALDHEAWRHGS